MSTTSAIPNPGSPAAQDEGCTCAVMDNHYGRGVKMRDGSINFWISGDCPLHAKPRHPTDATQEPRT
jgi:hypothetical protein